MLEALRKLWGCSLDQAEHTVRSNEKHAALVVSRRGFFGASAVALAAPTALISMPEEKSLIEVPERRLITTTEIRLGHTMCISTTIVVQAMASAYVLGNLYISKG